MFSLKKSKLAHPLAWVRGKIGSRSRGSVDVGRRESSVVSVRQADAASNASTHRSGNEQGSRVIIVRPRDSATSDYAELSQSEPAIGPHSNPDDFRIISENGFGIEKAKSAGTVEINTTSNQRTRVGKGSKQKQEASGLRRRIKGNANGKGESGGPSRMNSDNGPSLNRIPVNGAAGVHPSGGEIALVPMNGAQPVLVSEVASRPYYLRAFLDIMYYTGTSRRVPQEHRSNKDCSTLFTYVIILIIFCGMNFFSTWESFSQGKLCYLYFQSGEGMTYFLYANPSATSLSPKNKYVVYINHSL